jgi:hypothetical protein
MITLRFNAMGPQFQVFQGDTQIGMINYAFPPSGNAGGLVGKDYRFYSLKKTGSSS